jgi:type IV secretion system protein VirB9
MRIAFHFAALTWAILAVGAADASSTDSHFQRIFYEPDSVVRLTGAVGWQTMIEFNEDERIENISIGDSTAWQVAPNKRARMLFIKPLKSRASTNMTVITTQRRYVFELAAGPRLARTPWIFRFSYPPAIVETLPEPPPAAPVKLNFAYALSGDAALLPGRVWDDGRQTYFEFGEETPMPAIFAGAGKDESLVNVSVRGRIAVVQQRAPRFTLRSGKHIAAVTLQQ